MDSNAYNQTLGESAPSADWHPLLQAMWWDANGDWNRAHDLAQDESNSDGSWVHAYLHRKEGDLPNAGYWYRNAGRPAAEGPLEDEWQEIVEYLLRDV